MNDDLDVSFESFLVSLANIDLAPPSIVFTYALLATMQGRRYFTQQVASKLADHLDAQSLSTRERELLEYMAVCLSNKMIAARANITEGTVKLHVNNILAKMDCVTRTQAASSALRRGLINLN